MPHRRRSNKLVDRLIAWSIDHPMPPLPGFGVATLAVVGAALLRALLVTQLLPWLLFVPVVLGCSLLLGTGPAVWSLILSAVFAGWSILEPGHPFVLSGPQWAATSVFMIVGSVIVLVGRQLREAFVRFDALAAEYRGALSLAETRGDMLAEREGFLSSILLSSTDCIKVLDIDGKLTFMSEGGKQVMAVTDFGAINGCPWETFWDGEGNAAARAAVAAAQGGRSSSFTGEAATMAGVMRWWDVAVTPILDASGQPERILSVSRDVTASRMADEQVRLLNAELGHRLKNTLALIQAIVAQTLREGTDIAQAREALIDRLVALGRGADILTAAAWEAADLGAIARSVLGPMAEEGRIAMSGPPVRLSSRLGLSLSLALHELATNAAKYGALSGDAGKVVLSWEIVAGDGPSDDRLRLTWIESGGPAVIEPARKGFGSLLIGRALSANFRGTSKVDYRSGGIAFTLDAPVSALNVLEQG